MSSRALGAQAAGKPTVKSQTETESGTKDLTKPIQAAKKGVAQQQVQDMYDRMEKVTGINKSLQQTILREYKPDEQLEEYYRRRLQTLNDKYNNGPQSAGLPQGSSNRLVKRILRSRAHRLAFSPRSTTIASAAQIQHNQNMLNYRRKQMRKEIKSLQINNNRQLGCFKLQPFNSGKIYDHLVVEPADRPARKQRYSMHRL